MLKRWAWMALWALAWCPVQPALGQGTAAPATSPPAAAPSPAASDPFLDRLLGSSVVIGVARTYPQLLIVDKQSTAGDPVTEQYRGNGTLSPSVSLWLLPGEDLFEAMGGDTRAPDASFLRLFTIGAGVDYDRFSGRQAYQRLADGRIAGGTIQGDYLFMGLKFLGWFAWRNDVLPMAFGLSQAIGLDMLQFQGTLQYDDAGTRRTADVDSNGLNLSFTFPFELYLQLGTYARLRWMFSDTVLNTPRDARVTRKGSSLGNYEYQHRLSIYTLGYVWPF